MSDEVDDDRLPEPEDDELDFEGPPSSDESETYTKLSQMTLRGELDD